ncbi:unnamed protein product [Adineta steineri]|uniref:Transmembrane protein n=1 Tax=Adineta steineri TaxID=433720 RepID=A0A819UNI3_9BILA|nr:unnamed protein product [Adineta steineri]
MRANYHQILQTNVHRDSLIPQVFLIEKKQNLASHPSTSTSPNHHQQSVLKQIKDSKECRLSINSQVSHSFEKDFVEKKPKEHHRRILFIMEPIIIGLILFPIIVLFWQCGWNVIFVLLNSVNRYPPSASQQYLETEESKILTNSLSLNGSQKFSEKKYLSKFDKQKFTKLAKNSQIKGKKGKGLSHKKPLHIDNDDPLVSNLDGDDFSFQSLFISYVIAQGFLLCFYLGQDFFYNFLKRQTYIIQIILLKCHIFVLALIYIIQWEMIWTIWDQYTSDEWDFELLLSLTFLFVLIVFTGHLSDLVCAPFLSSYDSIEYCLQSSCPLLTRQMKQWKINLINFILYEIIISNIIIIIWRGFYHFIDVYFYPDDWVRSVWICLLIGYIFYFPLMYFQNYLENLNLKYEFWTFISTNFPQFYENIRHLFAFISCLFLWRGFWLLYDSYIDIFESYFQTCLLLYLSSFLILSLIQTASSINGPLNTMKDENGFFPLYSNCYVSTTFRKLCQLPFFNQN